jgi:DNA-directed RNA polymerase subunit RPC12/RpoP
MSVTEYIPVICPKCGKEFSLVTGQSINQDGTERKEPWCMKCHLADAKDKYFCHDCGTELQEDIVQVDQNSDGQGIYCPALVCVDCGRLYPNPKKEGLKR